MTATEPVEGEQFTYNGEQRGQSAATALLPGTVVTVREVVPAAEAGAHDTSEDAVVVEWDIEGPVVVGTREENAQVPSVVTADDGSITVELRAIVKAIPIMGTGTIRRATSIGVGEFADLFTEV